MVRLAIGVLVAAAGCDVVFPPGDYDAPSYSLHMDTAYIGTDVDIRPGAVSPGAAVYLVEDSTMPDGFARTPAEVRGPGEWYAEIDADGASVMFTVPELDYVRILQLPQRDLVGRSTVLRRAGANPGDDTAQIAIDATFASGFFSGRLQTYVVGAWVVHDYTGGEIPPAGAMSFVVAAQPYSRFLSVSGTQRYQITSDDQVTILRYDTNNNLIGALQVPPFDQGPSVTLTGLISAVTPDRQASFVLDDATFERLTTVRPAVATPTQSYAIYASSGLPVGVAAGPALCVHTMVPAEPPAVTAPYGNPFDWPDTLRIAANAYRTVTPDGGTDTVPLYAGTVTITGLSDVPPMFVDAPIPTEIRLGTSTLTNDNAVVTIDRTRPVEITAAFDRMQNGAFVLTLFELVPASPSGYTKVARAEILAREPVWRVPAEIFDVGHVYFIRAAEFTGGYPDLDTGDARSSPPVTVGYLDSGVFQAP